MTAQPILETLAKEFSTDVPSVQAVFEMLDAGLTAPFIGRFRRGRTGAMSENHVRRLGQRRDDLQELDRRRGTVLRALERDEGIPEKALAEVRNCMDRFELEDLYVPHRRPEPEVQLAMDRGLGALADLIVQPTPKEERPTKPKRDSDGSNESPSAEVPATGAGSEDPPTEQASAAESPAVVDTPVDTPGEPPADVPAVDSEEAPTAAGEAVPPIDASIELPDTPPPSGYDAELPEDGVADGGGAAEEASPEIGNTEAGDTSTAQANEGDTASENPGEVSPDSAGDTAEPSADAAVSEAAAPEAAAPAESSAPASDAAPASAAEASDASATAVAAPTEAPAAGVDESIPTFPKPEPTPQPEALVMTAELSKLCEPFVDPDKGVHTDVEALAGAIRILSDRIGRDARLRGHVRRVMRKKGVLRVRAIVDDKKAGRHKNLLKVKSPIRQLQGHRLMAIRQAQKERVINTMVELAPREVMGRVRAALGKHTRPEFDALLEDIALKALQHRIIPVVEADVRLELKERCDAEALRFLGSHLRQILTTPFFGRLPVGGIDVSAKGDLAIAFLDMHGGLVGETRLEVGEKDAATLGAELKTLVEQHRPEAFAVGSGKSARAAGRKVREALAAVSCDVPVMVVNDAGATSYANGQRARVELSEQSVPTRLAITIGRRLQDPMGEFLKVDAKQLGLGPEQRLVSKANLRRVLDEARDSAVAFVGCDFDTAPRSVIEHLPGLDEESAKRLADKRDAGEIESREQIRADGILTEAQWTSVAAFLRIRRSPEPLDRTSLHPEQYALARQLLESAGGSVEESLGRPGGTKGLRRQTFDVDEFTWRDLMRELSFPGRDPRGRNRVPSYISENTDPIRLQKGRVVEGVVTNVASFGAFLDVGRKQDAMVHISELASRYIRDARELLSVGETVRAKIVDGSSSRMALSLKDVPAPERQPGTGGGSPRRGGGRGGPRGGGGSRRGGGGHRREEQQPKGPAGRIWRRDGAAGAATSRGGSRRGGPRRGGRDDRGERLTHEERMDLKKLSSAETPANNPFASFFKKDDKAAQKEAPQQKQPKQSQPKQNQPEQNQPEQAQPTPMPPDQPQPDDQTPSE